MAEESLSTNVDKAILVLNVPNLSHISHTSIPIIAAATRTRSHLLIIIFSPLFDGPAGDGSWDPVQKLLTHAYVQATNVLQKHDKVLIGVDILLRGTSQPAKDGPVDDWDVIFYAGKTEKVPISQSWLSLPVVHLQGEPDHPFPGSVPITDSHTYPVVALGGTFDHLHAGHKILLSMAAWITAEKIIVGVTDDVLLLKKNHKHLLQPLSVRMDAVRDFLRLFKPGLIYDITPLTDVYGPTGWDPNVQALVVSKETLPGAASIASLRSKKSFPPLKTFVIDVISAASSNIDTDDPETLKNTKMSSTFIREWIFKQETDPNAGAQVDGT